MDGKPESELVADRYQILSELGRGGFATVYRAHDTRLDREVALKVITGAFTDEESFVARFRQEARTAASLNHPNIVPVYDFGETDGALYLAMALIGQGRTLRDLLDEQGPLGLEQALPILSPLADALDYLHHHDPPLAHRDVKPANVLLEGEEDRPWVVLTDFGLVRSLHASTELTRTGSILGTPAYMAPEQAGAERWGQATPLTDVYALGAVAYEMLAGCPPFEGETPTVLVAHASEPPPSPLEYVPALGDELSTVLLRALRKPPAERYPSAGAFVDALQGVAESWTEAAERETTLEQLEAQAQELLEAKEWLEALDCCTQMVRLDPDRPAALKMLTRAKQGLDRERAEAVRRRRLAERYQAGLDLLEEGRWGEARTALAEVAEGNPDFREVQERLAQAQDELQRAQWYDEAIAHAEAERWAEACKTWVNVLRGRLDYRGGDAAGRLLDATEEWVGRYDELIQGFKHSRQALSRYDELTLAIQAQDWEEAIAAGEALRQLGLDLEGAQTWIASARRQLEDVRRHTAQAPKGDTMVWEKDGKEMVRIPAGTFLYGDDKEERELPEFWIDKTPVTNAEYARFVGATDHDPPKHWDDTSPPAEIADHPVVYVSWHDAQAYAEWAGKRLPSEEEWEKAARGADGRMYPWENEEPTPELCNFDKNEDGTTPVGKYSPQGDSPYGCVDMAGNVWEWTATEFGGRRVLRGGSFDNSGRFVRCAVRYRLGPCNRDWLSGFRVVASPVRSDL